MPDEDDQEPAGKRQRLEVLDILKRIGPAIDIYWKAAGGERGQELADAVDRLDELVVRAANDITPPSLSIDRAARRIGRGDWEEARGTSSETRPLVCEAFVKTKGGVVERSRQRGFKGGWTIEAKEEEEKEKEEEEEKTRRQSEAQRIKSRLGKTRPEVLVINIPEVRRKEEESQWREALEVCEEQARLGGVFVLSHPVTSRMWSSPETRKKLGKVLGACAARTEVAINGLKEATRLVTNSWCIAEMAESKGIKDGGRIN